MIKASFQDIHISVNNLLAYLHWGLGRGALGIFHFKPSFVACQTFIWLRKISIAWFLIYLNLLYFLLHYLQEYSKIWNIAKSYKSELWNRLSYRGLPYLFEVRSQTLRNNCKISRLQPQNSTSIVIRPQRPRKATVRIRKKCHGIIPFLPYMLKIASVFLCNLCLG